MGKGSENNRDGKTVEQENTIRWYFMDVTAMPEIVAKLPDFFRFQGIKWEREGNLIFFLCTESKKRKMATEAGSIHALLTTKLNQAMPDLLRSRASETPEEEN